MSILIAGGTGFVGRHLITRIPGCVVTSRNAEQAKQRLGDQVQDAISWDPETEPLNLGDRDFRAVVNLAGESIADGRWNEAKKKRIRDSRVDGTRGLVEAIVHSEKKPEVLVSASAVGIYKSQGDRFLPEDAEYGEGFLADVCQEWEAEAQRAEEAGVRVVILRIGIVLGADGGALQKMLPLFRWGVGARLGSGQQFVPWIHVDDLVRMIEWAIENPQASGVYNATAPNPCRNAELTRELAAKAGKPSFLSAPRFGLRLVLGEFADSLLASHRAIPRKAAKDGFTFHYENISDAVNQLV